jgi:hypothetical protein
MKPSKSLIILVHVLGWLAFIFFPIMFLTHPLELQRMHHLWIFISGVVISNLILMAFFYLNYALFVPRYYFARKYVLFYGLGLVSLVVFTTIMVSNPMFAPPPHMPPPENEFVIQPQPMGQYGSQPPGAPPSPATGQIGARPPGAPPPLPPPEHIGILPFALANVFKFAVVFFVSLGLRTNRQLRLIEKEKMETNLQFLKAQVNPHFLFNTLNSIYSLTVKKSDDAPEAVAKLSSIMRYVTSGTDHDFVSLEKEIGYLQDYIDLQKMRLTPNNKVDYVIKGFLGGLQVTPLIFIPFVENCFKYGTSTEIDSYVQIVIEVVGKDLRFCASNKIAHKPQEHETSGTGLKNVKHRLDVLYPGTHTLTITNSNNVYTVELNIKLH